MRRALALLALLVAGCSREPPPDPSVVQAVARFDRELVQFQQSMNTLRARFVETEKDFRGRTLSDDLDQWVLSRAARDEITALRRQALKSRYLGDAQQLLTHAGKIQEADALRVKAISEYWFGHRPAPFWRRYWHSLFESNGLPEETPDSLLLSVERRLNEDLGRGDFKTAAGDAEELNDIFREARERASGRIMKLRVSKLTFTPRTTACLRSPATRRDGRAALVRGESVDKFYPEEAIRRIEDGAVTLRAHIDRTGCARAVAVVVHSGINSLDNAALQWFETATFSPATSNGVSTDSEITWKVRFVIKD